MGGDPKAVLQADADIALNMFHFDVFESDYQKEYEALNKVE